MPTPRDPAHMAKMSAAKAEKRLEYLDQHLDKLEVTVEEAIAALRGALDREDHRMAKAAAIAYGVTIDKFLLLIGKATSRSEIVKARTPEETLQRAQQLRDELAARREARQQAG